MLRKKTDATDPADWFAFAEERLRAADLLWQHEGLTATGIETLHESVERYLKGYLLANGWQLVKTHDLERLVTESVARDQAFAKFASLAVQLTEDFFTQHYPGEDTATIGLTYEGMRKEAGELIDLIKLRLPAYF